MNDFDGVDYLSDNGYDDLEDLRRIKANSYIRVKRSKIKRKAVNYLGGKCLICGYSGCIEALEFHHVLPITKSFNISEKCGSSFNVLIPELDKCVLLCSNCHREVEAGITNLPYP